MKYKKKDNASKRGAPSRTLARGQRIKKRKSTKVRAVLAYAKGQK